jgi:LysR family transcriptional regulator of abg operon
MTEPFVLIARGGFAAPETGLTVAEAARHQWIFPLADGATRRQLEAVFLSAGVAAPRRVIYSDSLATMKALMRVSDYITVLPQSVVAAEIEAGILHSVPLIGGPPPRQLAAWRMKFDEPTPLAKRFLASVEQACKARLSQDA